SFPHHPALCGEAHSWIMDVQTVGKVAAAPERSRQMPQVKHLLDRRIAHSFVGRVEELGPLMQILEPEGPLGVHLHGIAGSGKSALLDVFAQQARAAGATVVRFDCRSIEPTEAGLLSELAAATGTSGTPEEIAIRLGQVATRVLVVLDTYEVFRLMDS